MVVNVKGEGEKKPASPKRSHASRLVAMALAKYKLGVSPEGKTFAYHSNTPHIGMLLRSGKLGLRQTLARDYYTRAKTVPSQSALTDALGTLEGMAREQVPTPLNLRVAGDNAAISIDVADKDNRVIEIADGKWAIGNSCPRVFCRTELTAPMIVPTDDADRDLDKLWNHVNVAEDDKPILLAYLVDALIQPNSPKPVLGALAEHGSAKSTTTRRIVDLIDPSAVPLRSVPRDLGQWLTAATGSWVVALDNLSTMPQWLSDAICRASTGDGDVKRQLYSDEGLAISRFRRSVIVTGIDLGGLQGDFTDRLVTIELQRISQDDRHTEADLEAEWNKDRATIFGGLLDLAAQVHAKLPAMDSKSLPRMADFGRVLICVDQIEGTKGTDRYYQRSKHLLTDSAQSDVFIAELIERKHSNRNQEGDTAAQIRTVLTRHDQWGEERTPQGWPKNAREVTQRLHKHAPALRSMGWEISDDNGNNKSHTLRWKITPPSDWS